ncbi:erythrulose kinase [Sinomonas cyclohexanicum]|uniref:Erythrulose kinase n=1 Tax=Sinomonas cyclohexanicum TaxID=322009 RepID=A0ABN6FPH1_SINCY|nr:dihydroxyacetone kinase family protein [Corynebacterium cyclohexanicum]BCT77618.1 erythrulose kinase [Corynebacterium cyclohexanicum]
MTRLWNDPASFADEMVDGFVLANGRWVRKVAGGVSRTTQSADPEVAVVIGGGSGHYPAFGGLVGPGLAHGAAMGNLFASPSAHQVEGVIRASERGQGVLLSFGNYAGDVLHFGAAQDAVRKDGIDCRTVVVTDDIFSAPPSEKERRRGIAGDLTVFKAAGGAAAAGYGIDEVERVAVAANARTRSMGVAFTGCTLPGADDPLFTVPDGKMAIGLGIHGEPGIDITKIPSADGLAELFVERLLDPTEIPEGATARGGRVVPILNGLGSVKNEELYVVYARIAELLEGAGLTLVDPHVGEFCTSFDMAGVSLTLFWVDDELERLWLAPAETPAFRTGSVDHAGLEAVSVRDDEAAEVELPPSSEESRRAAQVICHALEAMRDLIDSQAAELGRIDAIAGDGDHGIGMRRGTVAAAETAASLVTRGAGAESLLARCGDAWSDRAGGTSGAIWGLILRTLGAHLGDTESTTPASLASGIVAAKTAVMDYGKAKVGDKTMVDALVPFADTLAARLDAGETLADAWRHAAFAAAEAAEATADLLPAMGRARSHGAKSLGTPDPGAVSLALIADRVHAVLVAG